MIIIIIRSLKDLLGINKVMLLLNEHGDLSFLFQNLSSYDINSQQAKFDKNLSAGSISSAPIMRHTHPDHKPNYCFI